MDFAEVMITHHSKGNSSFGNWKRIGEMPASLPLKRLSAETYANSCQGSNHSLGRRSGSPSRCIARHLLGMSPRRSATALVA
jgi:hypothetical protein